jgi:hypothetical protein
MRTKVFHERGALASVKLPREIEEFDFRDVATVLRLRATDGREKDCPPVPLPEISLAIWEFRVFLALRRKHPKFPLVPSGRIDEAWHQFLWFTPQQPALSAIVTPGEVFHHVPGFGLDPLGEELLTRILVNTKKLLQKEHGGWMPESYHTTTAQQLLCGTAGSGTIDLTKNTHLTWDEQEAILQA